MFCHLGRVIGLLQTKHSDDDAVLEQLLDLIYRLSGSWGQVAKRLNVELTAIAEQFEWNPQTFLSLEAVVAGGFNACGLYPNFNGWGLRVDVLPMSENWALQPVQLTAG